MSATAASLHAEKDCGTNGSRKRSLFLTPRALANALQAGEELTDYDFDQFVPAQFQGACRNATPLAVATRAAELLTNGKAVRVLDAGTGIGKFAIIGALTTKSLFTGVEHRLPLLRAARGVALRLGARRVTLLHGTVADVELGAFDAIYLLDSPRYPGDGVPEERMSRTEATWRKLPDARKGTRLVTYGGGGCPPGYRMVLMEPAGEERLSLFTKD